MRERPITCKSSILLMLFVIVILTETGLTFTNPTEDGLFNWGIFRGYQCDYPAFITTVTTVFFFTLVSRIQIRNPLISGILSVIGKNTLGIYLFETVSDALIYPGAVAKYSFAQLAERQLGFVLLSYIISLCISIIVTRFIDIGIQSVKTLSGRFI